MKLRQLDDVWNQVMTVNTRDCQECWSEVEKWKQRFIGAVMIHSYGEDIEDIVKAIEEL